MASLAQQHPVARVTAVAGRAARLEELGLNGPLVERQASLGQRQVDGSGRFHCAVKVVGSRRDLIGQGAEDALDLMLLGELQLAPPVVEFDDLQRLNEEGLPAGRDVVRDPGHQVAAIGTHRNHVAALAHGDDRILDRLGDVRARQQPAKPLEQPLVGLLQLAPDLGQPLRGGVEDLSARPDGAREIRLQPAELRDRESELGEPRVALGPVRKREEGSGQRTCRLHRVERLA
ncbi:hypothetical protein HRbin26_00828 [bacterium HR26]|nr:hypothetical protein HRbin26_00828 [bacterium HR26]